MNPTEFCYWLQGFFELQKESELKQINETQIKIIKDHLQLVFKKETPFHNKDGSPKFHGTCGTSAT